jgi:hypothetical protein
MMMMSQDNKKEPQLLLEGDEFHVSHDGIARSFYCLSAGSSSSPALAPPLALEEFYDLKGAHKTFVVRVEEPFDNPIGGANGGDGDDGASSHSDVGILSKQTQGVAPLGRPIASIDIQEIDQGVFGSAGTGSTTWEASVAMALFFSSHPDQLFGDAVEVGCGVGLGGILSTVGSLLDERYGYSKLKSVTLTDGNPEVLKQCKHNLRNVLSSLPVPVNSFPPIQVSGLDWGDFVNPGIDTKETGSHKAYHTVIACDCAYLHTDIEALSRTLKGLLKEDASARIHLFAPYNRSALPLVIQYLQEQLDLDVFLEWVEMKRFRLKPGSRENKNHERGQSSTSMDECAYASKSIVKFLHVTAAHRINKSRKDDEPLADIDL